MYHSKKKLSTVTEKKWRSRTVFLFVPKLRRTYGHNDSSISKKKKKKGVKGPTVLNVLVLVHVQTQYTYNRPCSQPTKAFHFRLCWFSLFSLF